MTKEMGALLEAVLDSTTMYDVVNTLSEICGQRAEHILTDWRDSKTANQWIGAERYLELIAETPRIRNISGRSGRPYNRRQEALDRKTPVTPNVHEEDTLA